MIDNSDIPLPLDQVRFKVLVFVIKDESSQQYQQINRGYVELTSDDDGNNNTVFSLQVKTQKTNEIIMRSNLKVQNNFGKQKDSIISWTDQEQLQYSELAISFEKENQCDQFWRMLCQKIGKNYLQICGGQKLQVPNQNNLNQFLQKAKNNIDLVDYNIVHSKNILQGFRKVFKQMKQSNDQMGLGILYRIMHAIMSPSYSLNSIQSLLTGQNFYMILDLHQYKTTIKFKQIYEAKICSIFKYKFIFPKQIFEKIQLSHRAIFYRENVLELSEYDQLQSMMFMISKQSIIEIMSYINRSKLLQHILLQIKDQSPIMINDKINLIVGAFIMYNNINSQQIKSTFRQNIFNGGILPFTKKQIQINNIRAMEILNYIALVDPGKFLSYLVQNFKSNSADNLLKTLMKKYMKQLDMRQPILSLIQSLIPTFNKKRQTIQFFNGTFVYSVLSVSNNPRCILQLANLLISQLENPTYILNQLVKLKIFFKLASEYRNGIFLKSKSQQLLMLKLLKYLIVEQISKKQLKNKQIQQNVVDSGYFDCCMLIYLKYSQKNNILSSSMLQNLKLIIQSQYSKFDEYLVKYYSNNQSLELQKLINLIKIKYIDFININKQKQKQVDYLQIQKFNHQSVLENQIQDSYLMNDQYSLYQLVKQEKKQFQQKLQKQIYLEKLKRMLHEVTQIDQEQTQILKKKKIVKKNENLKQDFIQFSFQLPDMNEIESNQY